MRLFAVVYSGLKQYTILLPQRVRLYMTFVLPCFFAIFTLRKIQRNFNVTHEMSVYSACLYWLRCELSRPQEIGYISLYECNISHLFR